MHRVSGAARRAVNCAAAGSLASGARTYLVTSAPSRSHRVALLISTRQLGASRCFSADTAGGAQQKQAGAQPAGEKPGEEQGAQDAGPDDYAYEYQEPLVARVSRIVWGTIKLSLGAGLLIGIGYAGYTIVTTLLPIGASSNAIMRRATDALLSDPDVQNYFGTIKTYGLDPGGRAEGRRYFVPEYKYEDLLTGEKRHRVKFTLEGERGRKAFVYAEVNPSGDWTYLLVVSKDGHKVISLLDRRPPEMSREERQARVTSLLQDAGWTFYANNAPDAADQARQLGDTWIKVKCVRCDESEEKAAACAAAGAVEPPVWVTHDGSQRKGMLELAELERALQPWVRGERGKPWYKFW